MQNLGLNEIRERYLRFFEEKAHLRLPSFSLVPKNDPSILLINAGMTPMKPYFTGQVTPPSKRVTTCQKCIRTGDIDNVGYTDRHGTFFEMLGNFSFGDYFKEEMIPWIWSFCTEVLEMPKERLYPSVYEEDDEAYAIWRDKVGVPEDHLMRFGKADNFWEHGTGPCGPCTEVYFDRGEKYGCGKPDCAPGCECDRFVEFWNSVFSQFNRQEDGSYLPLDQKNIDTGVGLERLATILQDVGSIFEVDTIRSILDKVAELSHQTYGQKRAIDVSIRIITDHIRSTVMMIGDGIIPSNGGRGYVLRRLMRRAIRNGRMLGIEGPFLESLSDVVIRQSGEAYPELVEHRAFIMSTIANEEASFDRTLQQGNQILAEAIDKAKANDATVIEAEAVFRLHDTYGFPLDLTKEIVAESGLTVDEQGFEALMAEQKQRAHDNTKATVKTAWGGKQLPNGVGDGAATVFTGYDKLETCSANIVALLAPNAQSELVVVEELGEAADFILITDTTPFYATGGGQEGDLGQVTQGEACSCEINSVTKTATGVFLHHGTVTQGVLSAAKPVSLTVDAQNRMASARNHTSTHLLHRVLRDVLGTHVTQAGSEVNAQHLRFDFHHFAALSPDDIREIEGRVNAAILADYPVSTRIMSVAQAKEEGAMALFDEKYGDAVRVVSCGDFSMELCGGTHLERTSQAAYFRIIAESSVASGVRRIEAVTGSEAYKLAAREHEQLSVISAVLKTPLQDLNERVEQLRDERNSLQRELQKISEAQARERNAGATAEAIRIAAFNVLVKRVEVDNQEQLRSLGDELLEQLKPAVLCLARTEGSQVNFVVMASPEAVQRGIHAGKLVKEAAAITGGGGGGRPDMAQAGGKDSSKLTEALERVKCNIVEQLGGDL